MSALTMPSAMENWQILFRPGERVVALPSWERPRLLLPANTLLERVSGSAFYPAFRKTGRLYRWMLRLKAVAAIDANPSAAGCPLLSEFLEDVLPDAHVRAVQVGVPGLTCKLTAQLVDSAGRVIAYLKCAHYPLARRRLLHEYELLQQLPPGAGPIPLKYGSLEDRDVLLLRVVSGEILKVTAAAPAKLRCFCNSLLGSKPYSLATHPWVREQRAITDPESSRLLEALDDREWPVAIQHGDLAPWNLIQHRTQRLTAIDWEYGLKSGFPGLDLAQYVLQVAVLIKRSKPEDARTYAIRQLLSDDHLALSRREAAALVGLAALQAYHSRMEDGYSPDFWVQAWRKAVWEHAIDA